MSCSTSPPSVTSACSRCSRKPSCRSPPETGHTSYAAHRQAMHLGVVFPQTELGPDRQAVLAYAQAVEALGFHHLMVYDHVLCADATRYSGYDDRYNSNSQFHEVMVLFGFLAAVAPGLELVNSVLILPQRQTALVAKQAAEIDLLTSGKFRLGV